MQVFLAPTEQFEILGHPIQLQHWLRVLGDIPFLPCSGVETNTEYLTITDIYGNSVNFNLTTGQPATEADYKAFCEIVGLDTNNDV